MFERYTENARRSIFFARFEASRCGANTIEPRHLLVGILKDASAEITRLIAKETAEAMLAELAAPPEPSIATSLEQELPLSRESKEVLACAAQTAEELSDPHIGTEHLVLALLRHDTPTRALLRQRGVSLETTGTTLGDWTPPGRHLFNSQESSGRIEQVRGGSPHGTALFETRRFYEGKEIKLIERLVPADDGKTLNYAVEISGPGQAARRMEITFELE